MIMTANGQLAIVTGASSGIGFELARCCADNGFDLLIAADEPEIENAAASWRATVANVTPAETLAKQHPQKAEPGTAKTS